MSKLLDIFLIYDIINNQEKEVVHLFIHTRLKRCTLLFGGPQ